MNTNRYQPTFSQFSPSDREGEPDCYPDDICPDCGGPRGPDCHPGHVQMDEAEEALFVSLMCHDFVLVDRTDICTPYGSGFGKVDMARVSR